MIISKGEEMKFIRITKEILIDAYFTIIYVAEKNINNLSNILLFCLPYIMYFLGKGKIEINKYMIIPVVMFLIIMFLKTYANKIGKGSTIPIPERRFTEVDEDGEVSVEVSRTQELLLWTADVEDWLHRKGLL